MILRKSANCPLLALNSNYLIKKFKDLSNGCSDGKRSLANITESTLSQLIDTKQAIVSYNEGTPN